MSTTAICVTLAPFSVAFAALFIGFLADHISTVRRG